MCPSTHHHMSCYKCILEHKLKNPLYCIKNYFIIINKTKIYAFYSLNMNEHFVFKWSDRLRFAVHVLKCSGIYHCLVSFCLNTCYFQKAGKGLNEIKCSLVFLLTLAHILGANCFSHSNRETYSSDYES